jgi:ADP-ribose pyrophosphatase YjhB (NUDIX family)
MLARSHCGWCGTRFAEEDPWPRTCSACGNVSYINPLPVVCLLVPVDTGLLAVRRAQPPALGELTFPGGYLDVGESWQAAAVRELREETGLHVAAEELRLLDVQTASRILVVFGISPEVDAAKLANFRPNSEISEVVILRQHVAMAWPLDTRMVEAFFARKEGERQKPS